MKRKPTAAGRLTHAVPGRQRQEEIHKLWDTIAGFEAAQTEVALTQLLRGVAGMVRAQNAYWFGVVQSGEPAGDPLFGWRPRGIRYLTPPPDESKLTKDRNRSLHPDAHDESHVAHTRLAGRYRASRLRDLTSDDWFRGETYKGYVARGVHDSLVVGAPVSATAEAHYGFLRTCAGDPFTEEERDIALYSMRGLTWFHRQVMLAHGSLVARSPLTPVERRVVAKLLTDQSEKSIASELGLSHSSLHTYVRSVLRKFGVSGRKGLTALWLGRKT